MRSDQKAFYYLIFGSHNYAFSVYGTPGFAVKEEKM